MKKISHVAASFILVASFGLPMQASAAGSIPLGGDCTSNPSGCVSGLYCVPGDYGSVCSSSSSGYVPSTSGGSVNNSFLTFYKDFIVGTVNDILVPVLMAIAFIVFLWGVFNYFILGAADDKKRADGRQFVLWGVIGFVIIASLWGVVNIVKSVLIPSTATSTRPAYPTL